MRTIAERFNKFLSNIQLTSKQMEDARTKYNGVCKKLHDHYYPDTEYNGDTKLLIGSYGKHTNIRPPRDVDVLFIMPNNKFEQYDDNQSNGQSELLQYIKKILSEKYSTTDKIKGWGKVVLVQFADGTHNVELLPAWEREDSKFIIPNTEEGGYWEVWDPRAEIQKISDSDKETEGKTRALIRMIKKWSENCSVQLKSFQIENKVINFFTGYDWDKDYSILVKDFFKYFRDSADENSKSYLETAYNRACKACDFENEERIKKSTEEWKKIFGDDFPSPKSEDLKSAQEIKPTLADYSHCEPLRWPLERKYRVSIDAYIYTENKAKKLGGINSDGRNLLLGFYLKFVARTNAKGDFKYFWQVVNTGEAAKRSNDLRGNIFEGIQIQWEHTKYPGKHWIECFIIQDNICFARSGKFFVNIRQSNG